MAKKLKLKIDKTKLKKMKGGDGGLLSKKITGFIKNKKIKQ